MSSTKLKDLQSELSRVMDLGHWHLLSLEESPYFSEKVVNNDIHSVQYEPCYLFAFGKKLTTDNLVLLADFLKNQHITSTLVSYYQPVSALEPALVFSFNAKVADIKPFLTDLSTQLDCQLAVAAHLPRITKPGLLVMDMDSTAITIECIDEIARLANVYEEVAAVTTQAMNGALEFSDSLRLRVAKLTGVENHLIEKLKQNLPLMPGVVELCELLRANNWHLAIASGGFIPFAEQVQKQLKLDFIHANELEIKNNILTGKVLGTIVDANEKARFLTATAKKLALEKQQTLAMGDGANDLKMMEVAGLGVAIHGKPKVAKTADVAINSGSLLQLAYFIAIPQ